MDHFHIVVHFRTTTGVVNNTNYGSAPFMYQGIRYQVCVMSDSCVVLDDASLKRVCHIVLVILVRMADQKLFEFNTSHLQ